MAQIAWDDKYIIGHNRIDLEHQVFVDLLKSASEINETFETIDKIKRLLNEIKKYAEFHFLSEENLMLDIQYPDYEKHKAEHQILLTGLDKHIHEYLDGDTSLEQVVNFMYGWFSLHTTSVDQKMGGYIKSRTTNDQK